MHKLTHYERNCLQDICDILAPFEEVTDMIQGDKVVTSSVVIPCIRGLKMQMADINMNSRVNGKLVTALKQSLERRLSVYEEKSLYKMAAALDPRFKLAWCKEGEVADQRAAFTKEAASMTPASTIFTPSESASRSPPKKQRKLFSFMTAPTTRPQHTIPEEITNYLADPCLPEETDPLKFWDLNRISKPVLSQLAMKYLMVPASSAPVERIFSVAGKVFRPDRCRLSDTIFQGLMFIKCNKYLKF